MCELRPDQEVIWSNFAAPIYTDWLLYKQKAAELEAELARQTAAMGQHEQRIRDLEAERDSLRAQLAEANEICDGMERGVIDLAAENVKLAAERDELRRAAEAAEYSGPLAYYIPLVERLEAENARLQAALDGA